MKTYAPYLKVVACLQVAIFSFFPSCFATIFYSKGNLPANVRTNWSITTDGTGINPTATQFAAAGHTYVIQNGDAMTTTAAWSLLSNLQIDAGGSLTLGTTSTYTLTIGGTTSVAGTINVRNSGTKTFTGNVSVSSGGVFTIPNNTTVNFSANLSVASGGTFNHYNSYDNATVYVQVNGDLSINGTYSYTGYSPAIWMNGSGTRYINTGTTALCKLLLRQANYYANGPVTINEDFYAMWNQVGGSFHTSNQTVNAIWGIVNNGGTLYVDGGSLTVGSAIGGMLIGRTLTQNGDLVVSAGTLNTPGIYLGTTAATPKATGIQSGGTINTGILDIGHTCTFTQSGGTNNVNGALNLNYATSAYSHTTGATILNIASNLTNNGVYSTGTGIAAINIAGSWINNLTFTTSATNTVTFNGSADQWIGGTAATTFNKVNISPAVGTVTVSLAQNISVLDSLSVIAGTYDVNTYTSNRPTAGGGFTLAAGTTLKLAGGSGGAGASNYPNNFISTLNSNSHVEYDGTVNQTVFATPAYGHLTVSGASTKTAGAALTIHGDLTINTGAILAGSTFTHTLKGNWYNNVSATAFLGGTSTVLLNGPAAQTLGGSAASTFNNLSINNGLGITAAQDQQVNTTLTLTAGTFDIGAKNLTFGAAATAVAGSPFSSTKMIIADGGGEVRKNYSATGSFLFPIGDRTGTTEYSPITTAFSAGTFAAGAYIGIKVTNEKHPNNASATAYLKRYWTLGTSGITGHAFTTTATYVAADINGTESDIAGAKYTGALPWTKYNVISANTLTTTSIANAGAGIVITGISNWTPAVVINGGGISICSAASVSLSTVVTNNGTSSISYSWTPAGTLSSATIANPVATPAGTTIYSLVVTDGNGISSTAATTTITVSAPAAPTTTLVQPTCLVTTGSITITAPTGAGMTYSINGVTYTNTTGVFTSVAPGNYSVTAKTSIGCISTVSAVTINAVPAGPATPTVSVTTQPTCTVGTGTITITAPTGAGITYSIDGATYVNTTGIFNTVSPGTYNVRAKSAGGCISAAATVTVNAQPVRPTGNLSGSTTICSGNAATLTLAISGSGPVSGTLSNGTAFSGTAPLIYLAVSPTSTTNYTIATLTNGTCASIAADLSGLALVNVNAAPAATISYPGTPFCWNAGVATASHTGTLGGTYSASPSGASVNAGTGAIDLAASAPGRYTITYTVAASGGCSALIATAIVRINPNTWIGQVSSDWSNPANWASNMVPTPFCPDVTILNGVPFQPVIGTGTYAVQNLYIRAGATVVINNATLQIAGTINNSGTLNVSNGTIELNGVNAQTIPANAFYQNALKNLVISNTSVAGVSLGGALDIYNSVTFTGTGKKLSTNDLLTLKSSAAATACLGDMTGNTITGDVTVERYISAKRAWHLLSVATQTLQTIKQAWQEGASGLGHNPSLGFGLQITTNNVNWASNGFDFQSPNGPSMKRYNALLNKWEDIGSTNILFPTLNGGYMTFVRGDRTANSLTATSVQTVLRTKGAVNTGDQVPVVVPASKFACVANPFASALDMRTITKTGLKDFFYVWDPKLAGVEGLGGYQTFSKVGANYVVTPGGGSYGINGSVQNFIQSGQAFLVEALSGGGSITFKENAKSTGSVLVARPVAEESAAMLGIQLQGQPAQAEAYVADGVLIHFDEQYSNAIDEFDALKATNTNENIGLKKGNAQLIVERRPALVVTDTIQLAVKGLRNQQYNLAISGVKLPVRSMDAFLEDNFLKTSSLLSLKDTTNYPFKVAAGNGSNAADRFRIIFRKKIIQNIAVKNERLAANRGGVDISWSSQETEAIDHYEIEVADDGNNFKPVERVAVEQGTDAVAIHLKDIAVTDSSKRFRVKAVAKDGTQVYGKAMQVKGGIKTAGVTVAPNPLTDHSIHLQMGTMPAGRYQARLLNAAGQVVMNTTINHTSGNGTVVLPLNKTIAHGIYELVVTNSSQQPITIKIAY